MKRIALLAFAAINFQLQGQVCPPIDIPDRFYQDVDNDGIDGDKSKAIFVDGTNGDDFSAGGMISPVKTIEKGITLAQAAKKDVYVAKGTYIMAGTLKIASGVSLYGQFDGFPNWGRSAANITTLTGNRNVVTADTLTMDTRIDGFNIVGTDQGGSGQSSYGVRVVGGSGRLILSNNTIKSGMATQGGQGVFAANGSSGGNGISGTTGSCDGATPGNGGAGATSTCLKGGGAGGKGGVEGTNNGQSGVNGGGGTAGGFGGGWGDPGKTGGNGNNGVNGVNGANATQASAGIISNGFYQPADGLDGTDAASGNGGGGGGGGGAQSCPLCNDGSGNGGGGGGAGGCGGIGGKAGKGGGASIAILVSNANVIVENNQIFTGIGAKGGLGSNGGTGGIGGTGGNGGTFCVGEVGAGGKGGNGGNGGAAGSGSGGSGGPSVGIYSAGTSVVRTKGNTFTIATAGIGGSGGTNVTLGSSPSGPMGISAQIFGSSDTIVAPNVGVCISDVMIQEPSTPDSTVKVNVFLSEAAFVEVTAFYSTFDSTALNGTDYESASGQLSFQPGEVMKPITVKIRRNGFSTGNRTFHVQLNNPSGATLIRSKAACTIQDLYLGVDELMANANFWLGQNYPNPCSKKTTLSYHLPHSGNMKLWVSDVQGKELMALENESKGGGNHTTSLSLESLAPGVYLYHLMFEGRMISRRFSVY